MSWACEKVNFESLKPALGRDDYTLHVAALEWSLADPIVIASKDDIKSEANWRGKFEPYHHQVQNLITFCRRLPVTLLADDVGLGKTISAGLILAELIERKRVNRTLVMCPAILGRQWEEELLAKFGIAAKFATGNDLTDYIERSQVPVVITTYDSARNRLGDLRADQFDMAILDEAHKLRNLHGTEKPPIMAQRVHKALETRTFKYVLMLTATPIQNRVWDLYSLIDLLAVAKGHKNPLGTPHQFKSRYVADAAGRKLNPFAADEFRSILRQYVVRTRREDAKLLFPARQVVLEALDGGEVEARMSEIVADEIGNLDKFAQISLSQAMMSSPQALAKQLENMAAKGTVSEKVSVEVRRIANAEPKTAKLNGLLTLVRSLKQQRPRDWRLVVFTSRKETQDAIGRALTAEGASVGFIRGGQAHANQTAVAAYRSDPPTVNVIVSTDAGAEGVNLQAGNVLVNYDLPWNPMVMEQRIGRIQRLAAKHAHVQIMNLVVARSVEERVVGRLMEKLQAITETIGDIETILESTGHDEEDSFEEMIRKLVVKSLTGQSVEEATRKATESIERAKAAMREEKQHIDSVFGPAGKDESTVQGPKPPKLEPVEPSMPPEQFVLKALAAEGAIVRPQADGTFDVLRKGKPTERITFKPEVAERDASGVFMGNAPKLYLPGRPPFERLVQRWLERGGHAVRDLSADTEAQALAALTRWCEGVADAALDGFTITDKRRQVTGDIICRAKTANGVDSLEKLIRIGPKKGEHTEIPAEVIADAPVLREEVSPEGVFPGIGAFIGSTVGDDRDIDAFCQFYAQRRSEEIGKAGNDARLRHKIEADFTPKVFAEVVAASGLRYDTAKANVTFLLDGEHRYEVGLEFVPASGRVLAEPPRDRCAQTGRDLPAPCLRRCDLSGKLCTTHLLVKSAVSGRMALPEYGVRCEVSGDQLLHDEVLTSALSGRKASKALFRKSPVSNRLGLPDEFVTCQLSGTAVLRDELLASEVSGKQFRRDEAAMSAVSGKMGHASEFVTCDESGDTLLPDEAGTCAVSGRTVRRDLLVASQKPPHRMASKRETVVCAATGETVLRDEVVLSDVSGEPVLKECAVLSEYSGRPGLPTEVVRCDETGQVLLPDEVGVSAVSGKTVRSDLLVPSPVSGNKALKGEMKRCEITDAFVLPGELAKSAESGRWFRRDEAVESAESGKVGHLSETVECSGSRARVLASEVAASALSGKAYARSLLRASEKHPDRLGTIDELRTCALTGKRLLADEVVKSAVSGKLIDRDLAVRSGISERPALPEEAVTCEMTGVTMLPDEAGRSDVSQRRVRADLLERSELSNRLGLKDEFARCQITDTTVLADELLKSDESGRLFRKDEAIRSSESGRVAHRSEAVRCSGRGMLVLKSEAGVSTISGKPYSKSLLHPSDKAPDRFGTDAELVTCAVSSKRILIDEAVRSAVSDKWIDRDLAKPSGRSGRVAMPEELVTCEESGASLLPDECGTCAITGKRVDKALLGLSELSGRAATKTRLEACAVTGKLALPSELVACEITGKRVCPEELETCAVSRKRAVRYQFVRSDISGIPLLPEHAVWSPTSRRCCAAHEAVACSWRGVPFPKDEVATCRLTGLVFSREFINEANEFRVLRDLLDGREPGTTADDVVGWLGKTLNGTASGLKTARCVFSPDGSVRTICGEVRAMLGFKVRHVGLLVTERGTRQVIGRVVSGKRQTSGWIAGE